MQDLHTISYGIESTADDALAIEALTIEAFASAPFSDHTEHLILRRLRLANALSYSGIAKQGSTIVGHIALTQVTLSDHSQGWFGLGPLAVIPRLQKIGIGSTLVNMALQALRDMQAQGCVLLGEPEFYQRFGFQSNPKLTLDQVPPQYFLCLPLGASTIPQASVNYHPAFFGNLE